MLGKQQSRCGLDKPDEETAARIRDLVQAVVEKAPKIASQNIDKLRLAVNGKWRLMFTNSEMFDFYNGVTGFANVFPAAKFDSLKVGKSVNHSWWIDSLISLSSYPSYTLSIYHSYIHTHTHTHLLDIPPFFTFSFLTDVYFSFHPPIICNLFFHVRFLMRPMVILLKHNISKNSTHP